MPSWNVEWVRAKEYVLLNSTQTVVRCSPASKPNISWLLSRMEELDIPIAYTNDLEEIYFTRIIDSSHGEYQANKIKIASDKKTQEIMDKVFIHELGHHVDEREDVTLDERLVREKKRAAKHMPDMYAKKNVCEYLAVGFEVYYLGTADEKKKMRVKNPVLYRTIARLHRKFSRK